jgi:hypothetical protein
VKSPTIKMGDVEKFSTNSELSEKSISSSDDEFWEDVNRKEPMYV